MGTINIDLSDSLISFVELQVSLGGHGTSAKYVEALIRKEQDRLMLRNALFEGHGSEPAVSADMAYFEGLRRRVIKDIDP